ncbi:DUF4157 domain-containing protein [uncultured Tenacibaculum sp.]|uniref:eCIS core domain-containing protein n=1 Tax=uncultured Tenacibaculum sp. TaxID=174713 RepID=UPI002636405B|nr:DUF4157 domain-containing protein [uncultured Tenacibaculum sp.]
MSTYSHKHESKTKKSPNKNSSNQAAQLKDNRSVSTKFTELQSNVDNSSKVVQQKEKSEAIQDATVQRAENKTGLPDQLKSGIEALSGIDMSDTRVHYNSSEPAQLQAHAFAQGNNIHIAPGQERHLAHEAWHVVQQKQGRVKPTTQLKGKTLVNDDQGLEREADVMGARALQMKTASSLSANRRENLHQLKSLKKVSTFSNQPFQLVSFQTTKDLKEWIMKEYSVGIKEASSAIEALQANKSDLTKNLKTDRSENEIRALVKIALLDLEIQQVDHALDLNRKMSEQLKQKTKKILLGYHGTGKDVGDKISNGIKPWNMGDKNLQLGKGFYVAASKDDAKEYAEYKDFKLRKDPDLFEIWLDLSYLSTVAKDDPIFHVVPVLQWWSDDINQIKAEDHKASIKISRITGNIKSTQYMVPEKIYPYLKAVRISL